MQFSSTVHLEKGFVKQIPSLVMFLLSAAIMEPKANYRGRENVPPRVKRGSKHQRYELIILRIH